MRRASGTFEAVAVKAQAAQWTWIQFMTAWGPLLMAIAVLPVAYLFGGQAIQDIYSTLRGLPISAGRQELIGQPGQQWDKSRHGTMPSLRGPARLDFTGYMKPLFAEYVDILHSTEYETWFTDARDADDVITAMLNGLLFESDQNGDQQGGASSATATNMTSELRRIRSFADLRAGIRKRAEVNFENFLHARFDVVYRISSTIRGFHSFVRYWALYDHTLEASCRFEALVRAEFLPAISQYKNGWDALYTDELIKITERIINNAVDTAELHDCGLPRPNEARDKNDQPPGSSPHPTNSTAQSLNRAARATLDALIIAHRGLYVTREKPEGLPEHFQTLWPGLPDWKPWETHDANDTNDDEKKHKQNRKGKNSKKNEGEKKNTSGDPVWAVSDVRMAEEAEARVLPYLLGPNGRSTEDFAALWTGRHTGALSRLRENLEALQHRLAAIESQLTWLRERLDAEIVYEQRSLDSAAERPQGAKGQLTWVQDIHALSYHLDTLSDELSGNALKSLQSRLVELQESAGSQRPEVSRSFWQAENCGGTSCFDVLPDGGWKRGATKVLKGLGLAAGRRPFAKIPAGGPKVGREFALYEKACCGESYNNPWLDLLRYGRHGLLYLSPYRDWKNSVSGNDDDERDE